MNQGCNTRLYEVMNKKKIFPKYVAEVGVWHPNTSNVYSYIMDEVKTMLVEPDPESIKLIKAEFNKPYVKLYEVALCDFDGKVELCQRGSSTFVSSLSNTPAIANDNCNIDKSEIFTAKAIKFSNIDNGDIELISIDTEGSEWFVIKNMISRPVVISIETHGGIYVNSYSKEIKHWMQENNYSLLYKNKSDSVYVLKNRIKFNFLDKIKLVIQQLFIWLKKQKKKISKKIKKS